MNEHAMTKDLLPLAASGMLDDVEQQQLDNHLQHCRICRAELAMWTGLAGAIKAIPTPQAPSELVARTRHLLVQAARRRNGHGGLMALGLAAFSWVATILTWRLVGMLDTPLARRLDVSSGTVTIVYLTVTWMATALAAGLLAKRWRHEEKTI